jgi:hypothetical protein
MAWSNLWLNRCLMPPRRRALISGRGQKSRHEHNEDDTQAEQFDWNDVRHEVHGSRLVTVPVRPTASQAEQSKVTAFFARGQAMGVDDNVQAPIYP